MEFKFMVLVALMGLILLSCRSYAQEITNKASTMAERPGARRVNEPTSPSFGGHNEGVNRKLLLRGPVLPEEKIGGGSSAETKGTHDNQHGLTPSAETTSRVVERDLSSKKAGIGNNRQLKGKQASSTWIMSTGKMINTALEEDQTVWQIIEKKGIRTSVKSYSSRQKRASLLEAPTQQQQISNSTGAFNTVVEDSNNNKHVSASPAPPEGSQPFSASHKTQSREDDGAEITRMDYTPAQRRPPIHNKSAP